MDLLDRKLLYELDLNARAPLSRVAKKLRANKSVVLYRFNRLREQGIIRQAFVEINMAGLRYHSFRIFLKLGNASDAEERKLIDLLQAQRQVTWLSRVLGKWDVDAVYTTKDIAEFRRFRDDLFLRHNAIIEDFRISLLADIYSYPKTYLTGARRTAMPRHFAPTGYVPDGEDELLLRILSADAMLPVASIAQRMRMSINTVKRRMRDLERHGIILAYRLHIDAARMGYHYYKLHLALRRYAAADLAALWSYLESKSFMVYIDKYLDAEDLEIELQLESEAQYLAFLEELVQRFGRIIKEKHVLKFYDERVFRYLPRE